ncbi:ABC transporter substrate-binding protein [Limibaculum sp. M0105]|uniref:ABC transporter substrate-binding protein n=2 Tax=Thermohalobaculum xanthum TaxID=2753746 RepID=A0A8J7SC70_9RHOB|nr:ABC transporter substrate-binding protein [Thermohalobaculum xanthum]
MAMMLATALVPFSAGATIETPDLVETVSEGKLPPVGARLPDEPKVVDLRAKGRKPGVHGGLVRMFVTRAKDVRYMAAWGYARLVGYNEDYELEPDILKAVEISPDGRSYTLVLRQGHRWSDGHPFTTEDLRYWWEDVALNEELSPSGPPVEMIVGGALPEVEVIDETRITYTWPAPNPRFLPALAQARPLYIYRPAHYVKQFHADFADPDALAKHVEGSKARNWAQLHNGMDDLYKFDNPELPVLQPWMNTSDRNNQRYVLQRNPYYHRVDTSGRQLPYIDTVELEVAAGGLIPAKATLGEADLQVRSLGFSDAPVLKKNEASGGYETHLWRSGTASEVAIYPNLTYADPVWRDVFRDLRFRRALSLAISRKAINKVLYFGLAKERALAALEESPFFDAEAAHAWADFDLDEANRLLDEMGLTERNAAGIRLLPDGRPMEIVIETAGERREETDALQIVGETWKQVGIRLLVKTLDRDILRNRAYAGLSMMVAWYGWNNGVPTPDAPPFELAPVDQANFTWPRWGQYYQTKGAAGEAPDMPAAIRLLELFELWSTVTTDAERGAAWREMLAIHADQVLAIGTVSRAPLPVVANNHLRNVPGEALYAWDPGAQLGIHRIDEFWYDAHEDGSLAQGTRQ